MRGVGQRLDFSILRGFSHQTASAAPRQGRFPPSRSSGQRAALGPRGPRAPLGRPPAPPLRPDWLSRPPVRRGLFGRVDLSSPPRGGRQGRPRSPTPPAAAPTWQRPAPRRGGRDLPPSTPPTPVTPPRGWGRPGLRRWRGGEGAGLPTSGPFARRREPPGAAGQRRRTGRAVQVAPRPRLPRTRPPRSPRRCRRCPRDAPPAPPGLPLIAR